MEHKSQLNAGCARAPAKTTEVENFIFIQSAKLFWRRRRRLLGLKGKTNDRRQTDRRTTKDYTKKDRGGGIGGECVSNAAASSRAAISHNRGGVLYTIVTAA